MAEAREEWLTFLVMIYVIYKVYEGGKM